MKKYTNLIYNEQHGQAGMLDVYLPDNLSADILLIYFHGGGIEVGDKADESDIYEILSNKGVACVSANYRMYPNAKFPDYVEDAAEAVAWSLANVPQMAGIDAYKEVYIGGISAGSYISMMLHFAPSFLAAQGVDETNINGYIFDAGQPTVHYNILRERGEDTASIRVDEAAPIWYLDHPIDEKTEKQRYLFLVSDQDMPCRKEQNEMLMCTMKRYGYAEEQIRYIVAKGYTHCGYVHAKDEQGKLFYSQWLLDFLDGGFKGMCV